MTRAALTTNSLVCLPTGLGKTLIAAVVMKNFHRWFPQGKVVFLAPTRPLVEQQKAACRDICGMPEADTCTLMGSTKRDLDGTRRSNWRDKRLFFCTPQTMENDLRDGVCPASDVVCLVIDEAHRAKGNHAYCMVAKQLWERNVEFRLLALTATPGHDVSEVQQVVRSLAIGRIDFRSDQDADVKKHTHKRSVKLETVTSTKADLQVVDLLRDALRPLVKKLLGLNAFADGGVFVTRFADGSSNNMVKPYTLLKGTYWGFHQTPPTRLFSHTRPAKRALPLTVYSYTLRETDTFSFVLQQPKTRCAPRVRGVKTKASRSRYSRKHTSSPRFASCSPRTLRELRWIMWARKTRRRTWATCSASFPPCGKRWIC